MAISIAILQCRDVKLRVFENISLSPEAKDLLVSSYRYQDADDPGCIPYIPAFHYITGYKDALGNPITSGVTLGYQLSKVRTDRIDGDPIFSFDNGKKFFSIGFHDEFDVNAFYSIEYFDKVVYILKV